MLGSASEKWYFTVEVVSGISGIWKTRKAEGCNLKAFILLKRNPISEVFQEYFWIFQSTFKKYCLEIVLSSATISRLCACNSVKWEFLESSRVQEKLLKQANESDRAFDRVAACRNFSAKEEIPLETLYKSGSTTDISLKCSKSRKTHRKHCRRSQFLA